MTCILIKIRCRSFHRYTRIFSDFYTIRDNKKKICSKTHRPWLLMKDAKFRAGMI